MKVGIVTGYLDEQYGGVPKAAVGLGRGLWKAGVEVTVWGTGIGAQEDGVRQGGGPDIRVFPVRFPRSWFRSRELAWDLKANLARLDVLILHQLWDYPVLVAGRLAWRHNKPYVIVPHGILTQKWRYSGFKKGIYLKFFGNKLLHRAKAIQAVAEAELKGFDAFGLRVARTVIENGIDTDEFAVLLDREEADLQWPELRGRPAGLFMGRLSREKGLEEIIRAWRYVVQMTGGAVLVLAGPDLNGYREKLKVLIRSLGLENHVFLPGMVVKKRKLALLRRADIYIQPSLSEGFSLAVLEALASGVPCVLSDACNFPEVERYGLGKIVPPEVHALGEAVATLLQMPREVRQMMGQRGRKLVMKRYTWESAARKMVTVLEAILGGGEVPVFPAG